MITVALAAALCALVSARIAVAVSHARRERASGSAEEKPAARTKTAGAPRALCEVGDVVVLSSGETAWLAAALTFHESAPRTTEQPAGDRTVSTLFIAPERGGDRAVYASADRGLHWLAVTTAGLAIGNEPLPVLEHEGERFERTRRLPVAVEQVGADAPDVGDRAIVGEYAGGGDASLVVVVGARGTLAWAGRRLAPGAYEVWPAGAKPA